MNGTKTIAPSLKALVGSLIDYAGMFPPAGLDLKSALQNFKQYENSEHSWMLHWFVAKASDLDSIPEELQDRVSLLSDSDNSIVATIESKKIFDSQKPVYCEILPEDDDTFSKLEKSTCFAKIRMGGIVPDAIPNSTSVAKFILRCADMKRPFKATAGLHHPIRANYPLTYEADSPRTTMHGFLNVLMASAFAWNGFKEIEPILREEDPSAFSFSETAKWKDHELTLSQITATRAHFIHSIGSCSFEEPVSELQNLGLI